MEDYKELYLYLFNRLTDLSQEIAKVQNTVEEMLLSNEETKDLERDN